MCDCVPLCPSRSSLKVVFDQKDATVTALDAVAGTPASLQTSLNTIVSLSNNLSLANLSAALTTVNTAVNGLIDLDTVHNILQTIVVSECVCVCV